MKVTKLKYTIKDGKPVFTAAKAKEVSLHSIEGIEESLARLYEHRKMIRERTRVSPDAMRARFL